MWQQGRRAQGKMPDNQISGFGWRLFPHPTHLGEINPSARHLSEGGVFVRSLHELQLLLSLGSVRGGGRGKGE